MKALIAAGGSGTRLRPLTFSSNKHMLPVANKPLLLYPFEAILETGIKDIGIVVNQTRPAIEALLGDGSRFGVKITYIEQLKALGLAHVVKIAEDFIGDSAFVYHLGDNIFTEGIMRPFKHFEKTKPDGLLTMIEHPENYRLGVPYFDQDGNLEKVVEKPQNPPNKFGVPGLYFFSSNVFHAFRGKDAIQPSARGELEITDLYTYLLTHGYKVEAEEVEGRWMDPGKFNDMLEANRFILDQLKDSRVIGTVDDYSSVHGRVVVDQGSTITSSTLEGPIVIGKNVTIEDCQIGPHVSIDDNSILKGIKISESIVMEGTTLEYISYPVVDSLIGKQTRIWEEKQESVSLFIGDHCTVRLT
jgi:glucose-1-phosphate thymidylyltransferase